MKEIMEELSKIVEGSNQKQTLAFELEEDEESTNKYATSKSIILNTNFSKQKSSGPEIPFEFNNYDSFGHEMEYNSIFNKNAKENDRFLCKSQSLKENNCINQGEPIF